MIAGLICGVALMRPIPALAAGAPPGAIAELVGQVQVAQGTTLHGDVSVLAGSVEVEGTLDGSVSLAAGQVLVGSQGVITGGVTFRVGQLSVAPGGRVDGPVNADGQQTPNLICPASSPTPCVVQATSTGLSLGRATRVVTVTRAGLPAHLLRALGWPAWVPTLARVLGWLGLLALALPVAAVWPRSLGTVVDQIARDPGRSVLVGIGALVLAMPVLLVVSITIIGIPLAIAAALALVGAWFFGYVAVLALLGTRTLQGLFSRPANVLTGILLGSLLLELAGWIPVLGFLVRLAVASFGVGAVLLTRFGTGQRWFGGQSGGGPVGGPPQA